MRKSEKERRENNKKGYKEVTNHAKNTSLIQKTVIFAVLPPSDSGDLPQAPVLRGP